MLQWDRRHAMAITESWKPHLPRGRGLVQVNHGAPDHPTAVPRNDFLNYGHTSRESRTGMKIFNNAPVIGILLLDTVQI